ncbi:tape measure protein [Corynebacterium mastitidis]|uniref:Tape measure protein N-terminal domain-containing protein n=1 Tax=Corynebacterium mastitidis TaxID=161890 RepID=A0A2N0X8X4_9CORY|nr:tape measure protein [Corynebacterium mastitidis]MCH6197443.1 tape measure protein [Corynebacterium mastitidis]PKF69153.1 hypothetical protein CXB45_03135 [Corynebacterium mastitidis]
MANAVWIPVNASMKGFIAEVVKQARGAASQGAKSLADGFHQGGVEAGRAAAAGLTSQAALVERASKQLAGARTAEAKAAADVLTAETRLDNLRKTGGASASQIARAEQQLETAKNRQADASVRVSRGEQELEAVRAGGQATSQRLARAEDQLAAAKTNQATAAAKLRTAELEVDEARARVQQRASQVAGAETNLVRVRSQYGEGSKQAAAAEKQLEAAQKQAATAENQLAASSGRATKARADLANATESVKSKAMSYKATQADVAQAERSVGDEAAKASGKVTGLGDSMAGAERKGSGFLSGMGAMTKKAALAGGALLGVSSAGSVLSAGFDRLNTMKKAEIMFENMGMSGEQVKGVMGDLNDAVTGTSVSMADASSTASMLMQAGVEAGQPLNDSIKALTNISAIAGGSAQDVGMVLMQIKAAGKLMGGDALQLQQRGINIYGYLAESLGKSFEEVKKMGEDGQISYEMVIDAVNAKTGDLAKAMGETLPAKMGNFKTAMASMGAAVLEPLMGPMTTAVSAITSGVKAITPVVKGFVSVVVGGVSTAVQWIGGKLAPAWGVVTRAWGTSIGWIKDAVGGLWALLTKGDFTEAFARAFGVEEDSKVVGFLLDIYGLVSGLWDLIWKGDYTGLPFGLDEDSGIVAFILGVREKIALVGQSWGELTAAFRGGDWGYGALEQLIGTERAEWAINAMASVKAAWEELTTAFMGGDWGYGALSQIIGEGAAENVMNVVAGVGESLRWLRDTAIDLAPVIGDILVGAWQRLQPILEWALGVLGGGLKIAFWLLKEAVELTWSALSAGVDVVRDVVEWFQRGGVWVDVFKAAVAGIGAAIGVAMLPKLAFQLMRTGVLAGQAALHLAAMGAAKIVGALGSLKNVIGLVTGGIRAMTMAMMANPMLAIAAAATALGVALWAFFTKTETGREMWSRFTEALARGWDAFTEKLSAGWQWVKSNVWDPFMGLVTGTLLPLWNDTWAAIQGAWDKFTGALNWAWETILKPVFNAIWTVAQVTLGVIGTVILAPLILYWKAMSAAVQWGWENIIKPTWDALSAGASWMWNNVLKPTFGWIQDHWHLIAEGIKWAWETVIKVAWDALAAAATWLWENVLSPTFGWIKDRWQDMVLGIQYYWENVWKPVLNKVGEVAQWLWNNVLVPTFEGIKTAWGLMVDGIKWAWENILKPAWDAVQAAIEFLWNNVLRPAFDLIKAAWDGLSNAIKSAWENIIKPTWEAVQNGANWMWSNVLKPAFDAIQTGWDVMARGIQVVKDNVILPVFHAVQNGIDTLKGWFDRGVEAIGATWNKLRGLLAKPVNFMIGTVYNDGIRKAWNVMAGILPGLEEASPIGLIPEYAVGGQIKGPGTGTSDDVLMWGSNGEHMMTAAEVSKLGGHSNVYALRDAVDHGRPFTYDGRGGLAILPPTNDRVGDLAGAAPGLLLPGYKDGGEIRPMWENQLIAAHEFAKAQHGKPYQWAGPTGPGSSFDCSGFMAAIAATIQGTNPWQRYWATMSFPSPGAQGFVPGLGQGFSVGIFNGGPYGGHTAGTLSAAGPYPAINVESGGSPSMVKYGPGAVGADHSQFTMQYHLPIGADGAFESGGGGGISPEDMKSAIGEKLKDAADKIMGPIADRLPSPPPQWQGIPRSVYEAGRDGLSGAISAGVANISETLGTVFAAIRKIPDLVKAALGGGEDVNEAATAGLYDSGGVLEHGQMAVNLSRQPEAVLTHDQWEGVSRLAGAIARLVPALEGVPVAVEELAVSYHDGVGLLGEAVRVAQDNPLARAAGHLAGPLAELGKSAFETYSNVVPKQLMGNLAHGVVTGHLEDAAGLLGIPTEKPAWLDAAEQLRAAVPGAMASARDSLVSSIEKAKGASQAGQGGFLSGLLGQQGTGAAESAAGPTPEAVETVAQGQAPEKDGQDWASFAAGILGAGSVMELGRNAMKGGIELTSMGATHGVGAIESLASQGWSTGVGALQSMASTALNSGVSFASNALNALGGSAGAILNAVAPGAGAAVAPFLASALPQAQMALSSLVPAGEMAIATAGTLADVYGQQAIGTAGMMANIGIDQVAQAGNRMVDAGFDTIGDELPNMPLPGDALAKLPEAVQSAGTELVGGASTASEVTRKGITYITNVGSKADAYEVTKHHQAREFAGFGLTR